MISKGKSSYCIDDIKNISDSWIAKYYLGVNEVPIVINSPLRKDDHPSFALYSPNGVEINYIDFSTREGGRLYTLLKNMWNVEYCEVFKKIYEDYTGLKNSNAKLKRTYGGKCRISNHNIEIKCKIRNWQEYDLEYWKSYGISLDWLKYANVYPISHKIIIKEGIEYIFGADKYAYVFVEFKDDKVTMKVYQPFNKHFKWSSSHDKSVISLWKKIPKEGELVCICASLKDALCLWSNTGIPAIALQGEGYSMSTAAIESLKKRYKRITIMLDNDKAGLRDAEILSQQTGFENIILPRINDAKDISDLYKSLNDKQQFKKILTELFIK